MTIESILQAYKNNINFEDVAPHHANQKGILGDAPMHIAAGNGSLNDLLEMIRFGGDINLKGNDNNTPLHYAVYGDHIDVVRILLSHGADPKIVNDFGDSPADSAAKRKKNHIADLFRHK